MRHTAIATMIFALALGSATTVSAQSADQCFLGATSSSYADGGRIAGNVGTNDPGGLLRLGHRFVVEAGAIASADTVQIASGGQIAEVRANVLKATKATVGKESPVTLPLVGAFCPVPDFACGGQEVRVKKGKSLALPPGAYGEVALLNGAELVLAPGTYEFCSLRGGRRARVVGGAGTILNVQGALGLGNGSRLGNGAGPLTVNVGGDRVKLGAKSSATAVLSAPAAILDLDKGVEWLGAFCAAQVDGGPRLKLECAGAPTTTTTTTTTSSTVAPTTTTTTTSTTSSTAAPTTTTTTTSTTSSTAAPTTTTTTTSTTSSTAAPTTTTTTTSTTSSTVAPTTTTTTTSTTSSTVAPTTTTTTTTSSTTTTLPQPLTCGTSNFLDVTATLVYEPRIVGGVFGMFMEVDYPTAVSLPGTGTASTVRARFTNLLVPTTNYRFIASDTDSNGNSVDDRARTLVTANSTEPIPSAAIERVRFDCPSGTVVQPSQFACRPAEAVDSAGLLFPPAVAALINCSLSFATP